MRFYGKRLRRPGLLAGLILGAIALAFAAVAIFPRTDFRNQVYTIGWAISPPFQVSGADGKPTGLAVDLVREAARRRGIRLQWVFLQDGSEPALRSHAVDLWAFITITPERLKYFHITEPFMVTEHCLL
ncbi:MAG TPA: transporter substrate-binding domain-containing protein, partial [Bryobacteraceae bacterium]|nr:transporter substrate-binding domain-containing protein [Bryobacteraceae bacterium]